MFASVPRPPIFFRSQPLIPRSFVFWSSQNLAHLFGTFLHLQSVAWHFRPLNSCFHTTSVTHCSPRFPSAPLKKGFPLSMPKIAHLAVRFPLDRSPLFAFPPYTDHDEDKTPPDPNSEAHLKAPLPFLTHCLTKKWVREYNVYLLIFVLLREIFPFLWYNRMLCPRLLPIFFFRIVSFRLVLILRFDLRLLQPTLPKSARPSGILFICSFPRGIFWLFVLLGRRLSILPSPFCFDVRCTLVHFSNSVYL